MFIATEHQTDHTISVNEWGIMADMYNTLIKAGKLRVQSLFPEWAIPTALGFRLQPSQILNSSRGERNDD